MLYELRKYEVMPGRMPALLDRFATFTTLKWKEYDVRLTGFWTPDIGGHNHQLIYILAWNSLEERFKNFGAWQASPERAKKWAETEANGPLVRRVDNSLHEPTGFSQLDNGTPYGPDASGRSPYYFELREYDSVPGKLPNLVKRFGGFTIDCFKKYGFRQVGYWTPLIAGSNQRLTYMLAWESHEERIKGFKTFRADPDRQRVFAESEKDGVLVERVTSTMLEPTPFSPMK
jgi:hypothetical protein